MPASEYQRHDYRDKFRSKYNKDFQTWFEQLAAAFHAPGDFQPIRNTRGDGGLDGLVINSQLVYQVYAPARIRELNDTETAKKVTADFQTALTTLGGNMRSWIFVHNHPEAQIGKKTAAALSELSVHYPLVTLSVLNIDSLWQKLALLPDDVLERFFPFRGHNAPPATSDQFTTRLVAINRTFSVAALEIQLPIENVWDRLQWEDENGGTLSKRSISLEDAVSRYYEWARLARGGDPTRGYPGAALLKPGMRTVILGGPGAGKSTLARKLVWQAASSRRSVWHVSLRAVARHIERGYSFAEALQESAMQQAGAAAEFWPTTFRPEVLVADGLDEAEPNRLVVADALRAWCLNYPTTIVVTTRPVGHSPGILQGFRTAELLPLSERATEQLAKRMLEAVGSPITETKKFVDLLSRSRRLRSQDNASTIARRNPLLLSFLVALHREGRPLSGNRSTLYANILELIQHSPVNDRIVRNPLRGTIAHSVIDALAWTAIAHPALERDLASSAITTDLETQFPNQNAMGEQTDSALSFWIERRLLEVLRLGHRESLAFIHPTLAEYCAARHLSRFDDVYLSTWITEQSRKSAAHETILLACGNGAGGRIVPTLLKLDVDEVLSNEAVLAAACVAEMGVAAPDLVAEVVRHLAARLTSPIPLVSVEAAEAMCAIAPVATAILSELCRPLHRHDQPWTRLGARVLSLISGDALLSAQKVAEWLAPADGYLQGGTETRGAWRQWPPKAFILERRLVEFGFNKVFEELPRVDARLAAEQFYDGKSVSFGEAEILHEILTKYGCEDVLEERCERRNERLEFLRNFDMEGTVERNERALLEIILAATGQKQVAAVGTPDFVPTALSALLSCIHFWDTGISTFWTLEKREHDGAAVEVIRGAIIAVGVLPSELAQEVNVLLGQGGKRVLSEFAGSREEPSMDWSRAAAANLDGERLAEGCLHSSEIIVVTATNLLGAGAGGGVAARAMRNVFTQCGGSTLYYVGRIATMLWKDDAVAVLGSRLLHPVSDGVEHVLRALGEHANPDQKAKVQQILLTILVTEEADWAAGAAEGLAQLNLPHSSAYVGQMEAALQLWSSREIKCSKCGAPSVEGSCPKCHVVPRTPVPKILQNLAAVEVLAADRLLSLANSDWHAVRDVAIELLITRAKTDAALYRELLAGFLKTSEPIALLKNLLALGNERPLPPGPEILELQRSAKHEVRTAFFEAAISLPIPRETIRQIARESLKDEHCAVRDAAARAMRAIT